MTQPVNKSSQKGTDSKAVEKIPRKAAGKKKTVKEMMKKHLQDKDDVITEEDFKNLELNLDADKETSHTPDINDDAERPKDEDKDPEKITPWDMISE